MNTVKTLLYMGTLHGFFTYYFPYSLASAVPPLFDPGVLRTLALPLWIAGTLVILLCSVDFVKRGRGTPAHLDPPKELVIVGAYRYVRNPIYAGALLVLFGYILWFGSGLMVLYSLCALLGFHFLIVFVEEPVLSESFGAAYQAYTRSVPRWIPKIR
ncbi:MAG TPA: isoprenylcysteine carboxylmethyltransferase family protein [Anaerolineales bacterium]|jgi:protein-S-isoprenylcysteine O-methyltransferase Ste14